MGKDLKGRELGVGLYQRANGLYEARAVVKGTKINLYNSSLKQLKEEFAKAKDSVVAGVELRYNSITVDEWFDEWFEKYKMPVIKASSKNPMISKYKSIFGVRIGSLKVVSIRNIDIQDAVNSAIKEGRAISSVREALGYLRQCFESARNNRIITINPCFEIIVPRVRKEVKRRFLSINEQNVFLKEADLTFYKEMFHVMFNSGLRVGEVGGLRWEDVDFNKNCIRINRSLSCEYHAGVKTLKLTTPKTVNSYRQIPFMGNTREMLLSQKKKQQALMEELGHRWRGTGEFDGLVFTTSMGSPVTRYSAERHINKIVEAINLKENIEAVRENREPVLMERIYPHAIRHTFCSRCFESGMTPKVVQMIMGHANYSTTIEIYTHVTQEVFHDEVSKFNDLFSTKQE